jgi:hypothetical protein
VPFPKLTGYQCTGRVEFCRADVKDLKVGQWVFACRNKVATAISNPLGGLHSQTVGERRVGRLRRCPMASIRSKRRRW